MKKNCLLAKMFCAVALFWGVIVFSHSVYAQGGQLDCELVKWPRADSDKWANPKVDYSPARCSNYRPQGANFDPPQPSTGYECERRGCFNGAYGLTCVYFPCDPVIQAFVCDDRGCAPNYGAEQNYVPSDPCNGGCVDLECAEAARILKVNHEQFELAIMSTISEEMRKYRLWLREVFFKSEVLKALVMFTNQMSAMAMEQIMMVGQFLDAKNLMETIRGFEYLQHQAHRDYTPSEDFCWFGTNVRSLADSEENATVNARSLSRMQLSRHLGSPGSAPGSFDKMDRLKRFQDFYCDPKDNNYTREQNGLAALCKGKKVDYPNIDIDYTRAVDFPHTLKDFDLRNGPNPGLPDTPQEVNIFELSKNLYGHDVLTRSLGTRAFDTKNNEYLYLILRSIAAKRSVAEHSFNSIIGLKSKGSEDMKGPTVVRPPATAGTSNTAAFLSAILTELGMKPEEIKDTIGENPSYYAQLEILAKKIYQNPDFYANLYDKPANVQRKSVALRAIERMLDQAILESQHRQEMSMAVLAASRLKDSEKEAEGALSGIDPAAK